MKVGHSAPKVEAAWKGNTDDHKVGRASALVRSLHELEWRKEKGGGEGIHSTRKRPSSCVPNRRKRRGKGGSGTRVRVGVESRQGVEKREKAHYASAA